MRRAIITIPNTGDSKFYETLFKKMGIKMRFLSDEEMEDIVLGKLIAEGKTGKKVSEEKIMKALKTNGR